MLSRIVAAPLIILVFIFLGLTLFYDESFSLYIIPFFVALAVVYMLSPQIDWYGYLRNPPEMDAAMSKILNRLFPYYQKLSPENKKKFETRTSMYVIANGFIGKPSEDLPEDMKHIIGACAVQLTFGQDDYRMKMFERIVVYPHPFPSPQFPKTPHASEIFKEDGVVLFSIEQLLPGITQPEKYYNIGLHEYAKIYQLSNPKKDYPKFEDDIWQKLEEVSGLSQEFINNFINLPDIKPLHVSISHFFTYPENFRRVLPDIFERYIYLFNQNPVNAEDPIIDKSKLKGKI